MCKALKLGKPDCSKEKCQYTLSLLLFLTAILKFNTATMGAAWKNKSKLKPKSQYGPIIKLQRLQFN